MKKTLSIALLLALVLSLSSGVFAYAEQSGAAQSAEVQNSTVVPPVRATDDSANTQIQYFFNNFSTFKQPETGDKWSYTVTDMNHNGRLELLAASVQGNGRYTYVKGWEIGEDLKSHKEILVSVPAEETFPDIVADNADTFYNPDNNAWFYMFYDNIILSQDENYYAKCSVNLGDGNLGFQQLAVQHSQKTGGIVNTVYTDNNGNPITGEQYNAAGTTGPSSLIKSNTNFEWFDASAVTSVNPLVNSYAVFKGLMQPTTKVQPLTAPVSTPAPSGSGFLTITKNPTNESCVPGGTAYFVANASTWSSLAWTFVSPQGGEYNADGFGRMFPYARVSGTTGTTLTIANVSADMNGWGAYCTFYSGSQTARTSTAYVYCGSVTTATNNTNNGTRYYSTYYALDYYTVYNRDGSYTMYFNDGTSLTVYTNGTYLYTEKNGTSTRYTTPGAWVKSGSSSSSSKDDGTAWFQDENGRWNYISRNGNITTFYDDGSYDVFNGETEKSYDENGNEVFQRVFNKDGSEETYDVESDTYTYTDENGNMYVRYSDGSFMLQYKDGSFENYDPNGKFTDGSEPVSDYAEWAQWQQSLPEDYSFGVEDVNTVYPEIYDDNQWGWETSYDDYEEWHDWQQSLSDDYSFSVYDHIDYNDYDYDDYNDYNDYDDWWDWD